MMDASHPTGLSAIRAVGGRIGTETYVNGALQPGASSTSSSKIEA